MNNYMTLYNGSVITIAIFVFILGAIAVKSARSGIARLSIVGFGAVVYALVMLGPVQLLSYAKPTTMEWVNRNVEKAEVLHAELREGDGIYLLLDWYGVPRYYKLAWNPKLAQQLIEAMEQARKQLGGEPRPGARSREQEQQSVREGTESLEEQSNLDALLGPMGEQGEQSGEQGEQSGEQESGNQSGSQGRSSQSSPDQSTSNQPESSGRSEMYNSGNGKVMMRFPFKNSLIGGNSGKVDGRGVGLGERDINSEAMFYAAPQPKYPEKKSQK